MPKTAADIEKSERESVDGDTEVRRNELHRERRKGIVAQ